MSVATPSAELLRDTSGLEDALDEQCVRCAELLEELAACRISLHHSQADGFMGLAKARYQRGARSVSAIQLPHCGDEGDRPVRAQVTVTMGQDGARALTTVGGSPNEARVQDGSGQDGVRKRNEAGATQQADSQEEQPQDPLRWFGVLSPQSLVQSQRCFRTALHEAVRCVDLQSQLEAGITHMHSMWRQLDAITQSEQ